MIICHIQIIIWQSILHGAYGKMYNDDRHEPFDGYGPGYTKWYVDDEGEIMVAKWNDKAWRSRTFIILDELVGKNTHRNDIVRLIQEAYKEGMKDQLEIIQRTLGIKK